MLRDGSEVWDLRLTDLGFRDWRFMNYCTLGIPFKNPFLAA